MRLRANAKINIVLDVIGRRDDGYHELKTLFYETRIHDIIDFKKSDKCGIRISCSDDSIPLGEKNIVYKAAKLLFDKYAPNEGIDIHIEKNIPHGAGLGGGSSDAAATLKAVNELYKLNLSNEELENIGACIGADVPFFISGGAAYACGIGEKLTSLSSYNTKMPPLLVIKPDFNISTAEAYGALDREEVLYHPDADEAVRLFKAGDAKGVCNIAGNSFEKPIFKLYPRIEILKQSLLNNGAITSVMTGSGSAVFAFFENEADMKKVACGIKEEFKNFDIYLDSGDLMK